MAQFDKSGYKQKLQLKASETIACALLIIFFKKFDSSCFFIHNSQSGNIHPDLGKHEIPLIINLIHILWNLPRETKAVVSH